MQKPPRFPSASAISTTPISDNGAAASIRDQSRVKSVPTPPRPSKRLAPTSSAHGGCFFETNRGRFSVVSQFEFPLPTQTILQPHGRSILALQGQVGARDAQ
jgi:hypothetical protein